MTPVVVFCCILTLVTISTESGQILTSEHIDNYWNQYKLKHSKQYTRSEDDERRSIFSESLQTVMLHNLESELGLKSFKLSLNHFADMTSNEFMQKMGLVKVEKRRQLSRGPSDGSKLMSSKLSVEPSVDWRTRNVLQPIQDQSSCGSCWTFSTVASIESALAIFSSQRVKLSEQELVDCAKGGSYISDGCKGGQMVEGFDYVIRNGISESSRYPYEAIQRSCRHQDVPKYNISSFLEVTPGDENQLMSAVSLQPVSVAIDAGSLFFRLYQSGVYDDFICSPDQLNHGVVAVGYAKNYWIVRNSWGPDWGESGYIRMRRGKNLCGISEQPSYPVV